MEEWRRENENKLAVGLRSCLQRPVYVKRDLYMSKETYKYQKRPACIYRNSRNGLAVVVQICL